jgi:predicted ATPase/DNA-binding SARP family transcriptional activator
VTTSRIRNVRIGILGPLEVRDADGRPLPVGGARLRSLLIRLAIAGGDAVPVDRLAADLWPDEGGGPGRPPADAANAVQALVSRLRAAAGKDIVSLGPAGYRLTIPPGEIDAWAFEQAVTSARARIADGDDAAAAEAFRGALRMWRGSALADVADAPFAAATVTRLSELRLAATEDRIDADLAAGLGAELVPELEELAGEHPLRERLRGQLMRALYAAGRQADALGVFEQTRELLAAQLGVDPSPALSEVHLAILRAELPVSPAQGRPPARRRSNLPAQLTSFVGRDEETERVASRLLAGSRLVTLTGPGGAGKTRLAVETGARLADREPDGVWFVPLAPVRDAIEVPQAVLAVLGVWPAADPVEAARLAAMEPLERLAEVLAVRSLVLILDNCEHVLDAVAELAARVLADAPGVRILATSREPLGLTGETLSPVPSLALPPEGADVGHVAANPAVRLFADRAAAVRPGFRVDEVSAGPVAAICRALDGIPLAIELAAARVRALTPQQVAERLDDRFALLSTGTRGSLPRHQTLRAIVDWSWDLLDDSERAVLRRLSVFSGGATPDSAEHVCAPDGAATDRTTVVDVIASLVDKSLVTATGDGHVRYGLLETVRAYAAERLAESGEADLTAAAHIDYFLDLAERAEPHLRSRDQVVWLNLLSAERDNLSAALRNVIAAGDARSALRFFRSLAWFWILRDYDAEAREWSAEVLRIAGDAAPDDLSEEYAMCQIVATMTTAMNDPSGDPRHALELLSRLTLPEEPDHPLLAMAAPMLTFIAGDAEGAYKQLRDIPEHRDPWVTATRRSMTGHLALNDGEIDAAVADLADGLARFEVLGDRFGLLGCLVGLAQVAIARDDPDEAVRAFEQAREHGAALAGTMGGILGIGLGEARARAGDMERARADLQDGVRAAELAGELDDAASGYVQLAEVARHAGDRAGAGDLLQSALAIVEPRRQRPDMLAITATTLSKLGCIAEQEGDLAGAAALQQRAIETLCGSPASEDRLDQRLVAILPINRTLAGVVDATAALAAARGEHVRAAELLGLAHALQGFSDAWSLEVARASAAARAALGDADYEAAYARGRNRDGARAAALALRP